MSRNLYEGMLDAYLTTCDITFRRDNLRKIGERSVLVKKGIVSGPIELLYRYDAIRSEVVKRLELKPSIFDNKIVKATLKRCGYTSSADFISKAKEQLEGYESCDFTIKKMFDETNRSIEEDNLSDKPIDFYRVNSKGVEEYEVDSAITPRTAVTLIKTFKK